MKSKTTHSLKSIDHRKRFSFLKASYLLTVVGLMACSGGTIFHEYHDVDLWNWDSEDTISFALPEITSSGDIVAAVGVRFTSSYRFNDLYLLGTLECDSSGIRIDTIRLRLFNKKGTNEGEGFPYITITQSIAPIEVDSGHVYQYKINHIMQDPQIKGIACIGLHLKSN